MDLHDGQSAVAAATITTPSVSRVGHRIGVFDSSETEFLAAFVLRHSPNETAKFILVSPAEPRVGLQLGSFAHKTDVLFSVVLGWWSPSVYDRTRCVDWWALG